MGTNHMGDAYPILTLLNVTEEREPSQRTQGGKHLSCPCSPPQGLESGLTLCQDRWG